MKQNTLMFLPCNIYSLPSHISFHPNLPFSAGYITHQKPRQEEACAHQKCECHFSLEPTTSSQPGQLMPAPHRITYHRDDEVPYNAKGGDE